jgi:hypothetical protein
MGKQLGDLCRHCRTGNPSRARGLCFQCYRVPSIRLLYPPVNAYGRRGVGKPLGRAPLPDAPTAALPGTPDKLATLEARAEANQQLFHPWDATFTAQPAELIAKNPFRTTREGEPCHARAG